MTPANRTTAWVAAAGLAGGWLGGCAGAANGGEAEDAASAKRDTELVHESCDLTAEGAVKVHADADGRPDIIRVFEGGRETCRAVDINRDSLIDVYVYFDPAGRERRREYGFDRDDRPDEIVIYENGRLVRKLRETNNDRKIDTWDYFEGDRLVREERDSSGDGYVDQWWSFPNPAKPSCAVVVSDVDGDGRPDEESRLDLCADSTSVPPLAPASSPQPAKPGTKSRPARPTEEEDSTGRLPATDTGQATAALAVRSGGRP